MLNRSIFVKSLAAGALVAAALAPANLSAQGSRSASSQTYHLVQISVDVADVSREDFAAKAEAITSCRDAQKLARELDGDLKRNRNVRSSQMPRDMQTMLSALETGKASEVYNTDADTMRIMVICSRN